jgi:lipopolysaccharide transport system permease protein
VFARARALKDLLRHKSLALNFLQRELRNRFVGTGLGLYLSLIHPFLQLGVYTLIFSLVFRAQLAELNGRSFVLFFALGLWPWLMFREGVGRATQSIVNNAALVSKIAFPRELLVYTAVTVPFIIHLVGFALVLVVLALFGEPISLIGISSWIALMLGWYVLSLALGLLFAAVQVYWRELDHLLETAWMLVFYLTPILFSLSQVPAAWKPWLALNPLGYVFTRLREVLLNGKSLWLVTDFLFLAIAIFAFWIARRVFLRLEERFDDAL